MKHIHIYIILLIGFGTCCNTAKAQNEKKELLNYSQAVSIALENNLLIKVENNKAEKASNRATSGNAGLLPTFSVASDIRYTDGVNASVGREIRHTSTSAGAELRYILFDGMGNINTFRKLKGEKQSAEFAQRAEIESIIVRVSDHFYNLATSYESLRIAEEGMKISSDRLAREKTKFEYGNVNKVAVLQAEVDLVSDSLLYLDMVNEVALAKGNLNTLLNREASYDFQIDPRVSTFMNLSVDQLKESALKQNATYLEYTKDTELSKLNLRITQATLYPSLSLNSSYGWNQVTQDEFNPQFDNPAATLNAGLTLSYNIFDGKKKSIERQNAKIDLENSQLLKDQYELDLKRDIENRYASYQNNLNKLRLQQSNLRVAELNFEQVKDRYSLGQMTATEFREAQLNYLEAQSNLVKARFTAKLDEIDLLRLSGGLLLKKYFSL
ncbi:transporter (plasmid) [Fulvitalea axinellae]|uniref:Transporter n=1 Tax=Fulvitalea axinellae TaxID=1182444 RepID=A0AAU9D631_9BACT|nr:transporter [Fulvitalea axinellae]